MPALLGTLQSLLNSFLSFQLRLLNTVTTGMRFLGVSDPHVTRLTIGLSFQKKNHEMMRRCCETGKDESALCRQAAEGEEKKEKPKPWEQQRCRRLLHRSLRA